MNKAWPYDVPQGWIWTKLEEIAEKIVDGSHNPPPKQTFGIPMLSAQNILNGGIDFRNSRFVSEEDFEKETKRVSIASGDVLLTIVGTIGRSTVVTNVTKFAVQRSVAVIKTKVEPWYLSFFFRSPWMTSYFLEQAKGTAQKGIYLNKLKNVPIPLAPLPEQRRIVTKIEALLTESKTMQESLDRIPVLLRSFRQSILVKAFSGELTKRDPKDEPAQRLLERARKERSKGKRKGTMDTRKTPELGDLPELPEGWGWARLGEVSNIVGGGTPRRDNPEFYKNGSIPWVTPTDLDSAAILTIDKAAQNITEEALRKSSAKLLPVGTVLFSSRATIGKIAIAGIELATNQGFANIIPKPLLDSTYLAYGLRNFAKPIERLGSGTTYLEVAKSSLKQFYFPLAPLGEQKRIVARILELFSFADKIEAAVKRARARANIIDQVILAKAFKGELCLQDPNDEPASVLLQHIKAETSKLQTRVRKKKLRIRSQYPVRTALSKQTRSIRDILLETGEATVEQILEVSGLNASDFWQELKKEIDAGRVEETRKGHSVFLKVKG